MLSGAEEPYEELLVPSGAIWCYEELYAYEDLSGAIQCCGELYDELSGAFWCFSDGWLVRHKDGLLQVHGGTQPMAPRLNATQRNPKADPA